jgi:hypothetical protein
MVVDGGGFRRGAGRQQVNAPHARGGSCQDEICLQNCVGASASLTALAAAIEPLTVVFQERTGAVRG